MHSLNQVWNAICAPFQWITGMPYALPLGVLLFGLVMFRFAKRNQRGFVFALSVVALALLIMGWINSRVPLTASILEGLQKMPLIGGLLAIIASAAGYGVLMALATLFTQIKLNRYIALGERYDQFAFANDIRERKVQLRYISASSFYGLLETGMVVSLSRGSCPYLAVFPPAFGQSPFRLLLQGGFNAQVIVAAIVVASACGVVIALFFPYLRHRDSTLAVVIHALRLLVYLTVIVFAPVPGAIALAVACAVSLRLSVWLESKEVCWAEDCIPMSWYAPERRDCLLCGFPEADAIDQSNDTISIQKINRLHCVHWLNEQDDSAFLRSDLSRDALWHIRFKEGDEIAVCARCRKVFFAEDFIHSCPLCTCHHKLWFSHPAALLMRSATTLLRNVTIERPYETTVLYCTNEEQRHLPDKPSFTECCGWLLMPLAMYVVILIIYV